MTCGSLGCGRSQFGGVNGNGHGLEHYKNSGHGVSVKLGTITAEGGAGKLQSEERWSIMTLNAYRYLLLYLR